MTITKNADSGRSPQRFFPVTVFLVPIVPPDPANAGSCFRPRLYFFAAASLSAAFHDSWLLAELVKRTGTHTGSDVSKLNRENSLFRLCYHLHPRDVSTPRRDDARVSSLNMTDVIGIAKDKTL